jgi:hypothetical protein
MIEQVVREVVVTHVTARASPSVAAHVSWRMNSFQNPNMERLLQLVGSFDRRWHEQVDAAATTEERQAVGSINSQRNRIAHGEDSTISLSQVRQYHEEIKTLLAKVTNPF